MISAIAIDDEPLALEILEAYCSTLDFISLEKVFTRTAEAKNYLQKYPVDLLFLDINMPEISGIDFYRGIRQETMVIFTTAHAQYAIDGFELSAVDFLLKPYSPERFTVAARKAHEYHQFLHQKHATESKHIFIRADYSLIKIQLSDILYIEGLADYLKIHQQNGKTVLARMTMKGILSRLPETEFIRVHRSFIVPFSRIESMRNKNLYLADKEIPIGASYEEAVLKAFKGA
ncbi:LytR/AlgR family response regulator transcription factor [Chryseolinea lacunae]|uniref:Response regulator transcription factor n=1 Tax=Chryseolinea lacunae TaxID=2801331 RepID=A0ABS1KZG8_9BACT|nr:LytTR family DNA-binding domain-containing protein [Chryseolinea lacunae]MBL0744740.1 response regulator transcription factor [Chryseolinea lacunae]